jgi:hypothetical protein
MAHPAGAAAVAGDRADTGLELEEVAVDIPVELEGALPLGEGPARPLVAGDRVHRGDRIDRGGEDTLELDRGLDLQPFEAFLERHPGFPAFVGRRRRDGRRCRGQEQ